MHRVELKENNSINIGTEVLGFLMHRVELKALLW